MREMRPRAVWLAATLTLAGTGLGARPAAQSLERSARDGVYTMAQAEAGETVYAVKCELCHGKMGAVTPDLAPLMSDYVFQANWSDRSIADLFTRTRDTMPQDAPGTLPAEELVDLMAYILSANRMPAGDVPLPADVETLTEIRLDIGQP